MAAPRPCTFCGCVCRLARAEAKVRTEARKARKFRLYARLVVAQDEALRLARAHLHSARIEINVRRRHMGVPVLP